ncbi:3-hydroxyacyl-CoA dehydrogenase family protein [Tepidibacter sp. Z1-5]|uniref:3-hydroxyacyl-CoA dehydrogenase family protein n=1 Tax=Tepidibacter sp. Z1-5 TaxID=3134138 RepID=UPI0030BD7E30
MKATEIKKIACIGSGVIGASWATNFIMKGYPVNVYDIKQEQLELAKSNIDNNLKFLFEEKILTAEEVEKAKSLVNYTTSMKEAVSDVQFIQESGPERYEIKHAILDELEKYTSPETIYASSTSGLLITEIAKNAKHPERCIGAHPYNPPHLIPLVELSKGEKSSEEAVKTASDFFKLLGKEPITLQKEALGFISNRLQVALYREVIELVMRGVCTVEDIDKAVCFGPGLRYGTMGPNLIFQLGGGPHGIKGIMKHIGPSVELWLNDMASWTKVPEEWADIAHEGVVEEMANREPEFGQNNEDLTKFRDRMLIDLLKLHKKL